MEEMCRLCLKECSRSFYELKEDCAFLQQISLCLSYRLATGENYPKRICGSCSNKIEEIKSFRQMIIDNEKVLLLKLVEVKDEKVKDYVEVKIDRQRNNHEANGHNNDNMNVEILQPCNDDSDNGDKIIESDSINSIKIENVTSLNLQHTNIELSKMNHVGKASSEVDPNTCLMCFKRFPNKQLLLNHYLNEESSKYNELLAKIDINVLAYTKMINSCTMFVCKECNKECRTEKLMMMHLLSHNEERSFACKVCGRMYITAYDMVKHSKAHGKQFYCSFKCGYSSSYAHILRNHEMLHKKLYKYKCDDCGKQFQVKTWLEQHQNVHNDERKYVCDICGASFHMDRYLTSHKSVMHPETKKRVPYICVHCSKVFRSRDSLILHLQEHDIKIEYLCDICGKVAKNSKQLKLHRYTHKTERPYVCG
ncbi:zinc finger protein OZF-like isoform X2 [Zerene cesonia]|nr:zinc finger protein OZF-like isoform X2 [Zerene cesonia]